jgi:hypothetical protein
MRGTVPRGPPPPPTPTPRAGPSSSPRRLGRRPGRRLAHRRRRRAAARHPRRPPIPYSGALEHLTAQAPRTASFAGCRCEQRLLVSEHVMGYINRILTNFDRVSLADKSWSVSDDAASVFLEANGDLTMRSTQAPYRPAVPAKAHQVRSRVSIWAERGGARQGRTAVVRCGGLRRIGTAGRGGPAAMPGGARRCYRRAAATRELSVMYPPRPCWRTGPRSSDGAAQDPWRRPVSRRRRDCLRAHDDDATGPARPVWWGS